MISFYNGNVSAAGIPVESSGIFQELVQPATVSVFSPRKEYPFLYYMSSTSAVAKKNYVLVSFAK